MLKFKTETLTGKNFELGAQDCYSLTQDFFRINFDIELPDFARPNDWDPSKDNLIEKHYIETGFKKLDKEENWPPKPADVLVCTVGGSTPNHLVVFLGGNQIIHHKVAMISGKETMRPAWKRYTSFILRHPDINIEEPELRTMDLLEVYNEGLI